MQLTQAMVDAAKRAGWKMFFVPLYTSTPANTHFVHPDGSKRYFQAWRNGPAWLTHDEMRLLMQ